MFNDDCYDCYFLALNCASTYAWLSTYKLNLSNLSFNRSFLIDASFANCLRHSGINTEIIEYLTANCKFWHDRGGCSNMPQLTDDDPCEIYSSIKTLLEHFILFQSIHYSSWCWCLCTDFPACCLLWLTESFQSLLCAQNMFAPTFVRAVDLVK